MSSTPVRPASLVPVVPLTVSSIPAGRARHIRDDP
jgi:hypothetical protein